jgi:hypothetical protein
MERLVRNIIRCRGRETTSVPDISSGQAVPPSWNPAPNEMRMKDVLFHNFFWYKGHKTASAPCPTETFWGTCTSAAIRQTASPRGIVHLICIGKRILSLLIIRGTTSRVQKTFVVRVCEGVFLPKRNEGITTTAPNNIRGTTSRGACDEGNLNNIALSKL